MNIFTTFFRNIQIKLHKKQNPILWTKTSEAFLEILHTYCDKAEKIIEIGCGTAHVSYILTKEGYTVFLNEIRKKNLEEAKRIFESNSIPANYLYGNLFSIKQKFGFAWNSGLIQCFPDKMKDKFVKKLADISPKVILFYPNIDDPLKKRGSNKQNIPGVDDAIEYNIDNIPSIMNKYFQVVHFGTLDAQTIGLPYAMYWIYGENIW